MGEEAEKDAPGGELESLSDERAVAVIERPVVVDVATLSTMRSVDELLQRQTVIETAMEKAMDEGVDFGKIPGVNKPTLLKPGAEKLCVLFQFTPTFPTARRTVVHGTDGHLDVESTCVLVHTPTQVVLAEGHGYCTTRESKYAYRQGTRVCPECGNTTIRKGKTRGGNPVDQYYCWRKIDGCGASFTAGSKEYEEIDKTDVQRTPNPDLADLYNTVVKMADKRALVAAVLIASGASSVFTQDVEDSATRDAERQAASGEGDERPIDERVTEHEAAPKLKTWAALAKAFGELLTPEDAQAWISEAIVARFGVPTESLTKEQKDEAFRLTYPTFADLYEEHTGDLALNPDVREIVAAAFAKRWEGIALNGPIWRVSPKDEAARPTHEDYLAAQAASGEADVDDIEFGKDDKTSAK